MAIQVVLLRHGIAQDEGENGDDASRKLTKTGIEKLKKRLPHLKELVENVKDTYIWSSPLTRARETAMILGEAVGVKDVTYLNFIGNGVYHEFYEMLKHVSDNTTIFVVGHEPYLSHWAWELGKIHLAFKKGGAACFKMEYQNPKNVSLEWSLDPREMENLDEEE